jgi:SAM-dependent MidA family methyltransferase
VQANQALIEFIRYQIRQSAEQAISFRDYMELCLYHPEFGYYTNTKEKVGKAGDFYTSVALGGLMGETLACYLASQTTVSKQPLTLTEWGGGTGGLAQQLLDELERNYPEAYESLSYVSVELSSYHRTRQAEALSRHVNAGHVSWMTEEEWLAGGVRDNIIVFSNELIDAFPVHRIRINEGKPCEGYVQWDEEDDALQDKWVPLSEKSPLGDYINELSVPLREGQLLEVSLEAAAWLRRIGASIRNGQIVTIDYGDREEEVYAAHRMNGTLMCYRQHRAEDNPYAEPGGQDITSHVNFTALIREGLESGFREYSLVTQKQFLVDNGILDKLQDNYSTDPFSPAAKRNRAIRQLLWSDQMSELFKVLLLKKGELL